MIKKNEGKNVMLYFRPNKDLEIYNKLNKLSEKKDIPLSRLMIIILKENIDKL